MPWSVREGGDGCDGYQVVNDDTGQRVPGGCHDSEANAAAHARALYANAGDEAATAADLAGFLAHFAEVDGTPWDGNAAMTSCTRRGLLRVDLRGSQGRPRRAAVQLGVAAPQAPGGPPNAAGVRAACPGSQDTRVDECGRGPPALGSAYGRDQRRHRQDGPRTAGAGREVPPQSCPSRRATATAGTGRGARRGSGGTRSPGGCVDAGAGGDQQSAPRSRTRSGRAGNRTRGPPRTSRKTGRKGPDKRRKKLDQRGDRQSKIEPTGEGRFEAILVIEGIPTGDGREFAADSLDFAEFPLPLTYQPPTHGGDPWPSDRRRRDRGRRGATSTNPRVMRGRGRFDMADPEAADIYRKVEEKLLRGVSRGHRRHRPLHRRGADLARRRRRKRRGGLEQLFMPPSQADLPQGPHPRRRGRCRCRRSWRPSCGPKAPTRPALPDLGRPGGVRPRRGGRRPT